MSLSCKFCLLEMGCILTYRFSSVSADCVFHVNGNKTNKPIFLKYLFVDKM